MMEPITPKYSKQFIPIILGIRPIANCRIANSGEDGGFNYHITKISHCFYSLYDFPIPNDLLPILARYGNREESCDYEQWLTCGNENVLEYDRELTSKICFLLTAYYNLTMPYRDFEFIPGNFCTERDDWVNHNPIKFIFSLRNI